VFPAPHVPVVAPAIPAVAPAAPAPPAVVPPMPAVLSSTPVAPSSTTAQVELLKLDPIKDAKEFLDSFETIQFYLQMPEFSTGHANVSLTTDTMNLDASCAWEGQLHLAMKDGTLRFLFKNKGSQYHDRGFEMLAALIQQCRPDTVSNAFASLLSLFNDVQGEPERILEYCLRFDGLTLELSCCKVVLPHLLLVMLFLHALHVCYVDIVKQFCTRFKSIETATVDSIVSNVVFQDRFELVNSKKGKPGAGASNLNQRVPAAATANTDCQGQAWQLTKSIGLYPSPSCCHAQVDLSTNHAPSAFPSISPLPTSIIRLIKKLSLSPTPPSSHGCFAMADSGATDHMLLGKYSFISYKIVSGLQVRMGNNSYIPVLGCGTAIFALNGKCILIWNALHIPGLAVPLYSLRAHIHQLGCGFLGLETTGLLVYFPTFVLSFDTSVDCHLLYEPLGSCAPLGTLHYAQPRCPPTYYFSELASLSSTAIPSPAAPTIIEDNALNYPS
jgi:hypothetical protein